MTCSHCHGAILPCGWGGEFQCIACGRAPHQQVITPEEAHQLKQRERANAGTRYQRRESIRAEFAAIEPLEPSRKGRPPGSKNKRSVAMEATA